MLQRCVACLATASVASRRVTTATMHTSMLRGRYRSLPLGAVPRIEASTWLTCEAIAAVSPTVVSRGMASPTC
jgi:hypothetical protein